MGRLDVGEADLYAEPRRVIAKRDASAMELGDRGDEAQSQSTAGRRAGALKPVKTAKYVLAFTLWNPRPIIGDLDDIGIVPLAEAQLDFGGRGTMAD